MANINLYATLAEYLAYSVARGHTAVVSSADDSVITDLLESASRYIDDNTGRQFFPSIETKVFDIPQNREIRLKADLLEVTALLNGDGTTIPSTDYILESANDTPYWKLKLRSTSGAYWIPDVTNGPEQSIELTGVFGYRKQYTQRAWLQIGTLGAVITDTTTLAFTAAAGHTLTAGMIVKIDSEIFNLNTVSSNTVTPIKRGDNGSTAATHTNGTAIYVWKPQEEAKDCVLDMARRTYKRRFGQSGGNESIVTPSGMIIPPKEIPASVGAFIATHKRRT